MISTTNPSSLNNLKLTENFRLLISPPRYQANSPRIPKLRLGCGTLTRVGGFYFWGCSRHFDGTMSSGVTSMECPAGKTRSTHPPVHTQSILPQTLFARQWIVRSIAVSQKSVVVTETWACRNNAKFGIPAFCATKMTKMSSCIHSALGHAGDPLQSGNWPQGCVNTCRYMPHRHGCPHNTW